MPKCPKCGLSFQWHDYTPDHPTGVEITHTCFNCGATTRAADSPDGASESAAPPSMETPSLVLAIPACLATADGSLATSLGLETLGGVFTPLIEKGTPVPCSRSEDFSTAADNQSTIEVHLFAGESNSTRDNQDLGMCHVSGIPPALRGVPKIPIEFSIDRSGQLMVAVQNETGDLDLLMGTAEQTPNAGDKRCFIATACYGAADTREVLALRQFRDDALLQSPITSRLVALYYILSPSLATRIRNRPHVRAFVRCLLIAPLVRIITHSRCKNKQPNQLLHRTE